MIEASQAHPSPAFRCPICGSRRIDPWKARSINRPLTPQDLQITDHRFGVTLGLDRCRDCGFIFARSGDLDELVSLYERLDDPVYEGTQDTRRLQMQWLLKVARVGQPRAKTLLDIGAGAGLLVAQARQLGLDATGVEPSFALVQAARRIHRIELLRGVFPHPALAGQTFDLIMLVDVIEHVADPVQLLRDCRAALAPGGLLLVATPDIGSAAARLLGRRWWHLRMAHVGYFDRSTLGRALRLAGLVDRRWLRARWFFTVEYLAARVAKYLPVGSLNRAARRIPLLSRLYQMVIPLNLGDSWVVLASAAG